MRSLAALLIPSFVMIAIVLLAQSSHAATVNAAQEIDRAIIFALADKNSDAINTLKEVATKKISNEDQSRAELTLGRVYYQLGKFEEALEAYNKVSKDSSYWLTSLEEKAWTQYQLKNTGRSLALLKTVLNPVFADQINSEAYFLQALNELKTCDYLGVFNTLESFKKNSRAPLANLEKKANAGDARAQQGVHEYTQTISKMQLAEVEAIQYIHMTDPGKNRPLISKVTKNSDQISFPESDEVWLDELDAYQVQAKGCPTTTARGVM